MAGEASRVTVTKTTGQFSTLCQANHQDFPEIRAEGATPQEAATQLINQLTRALDSALTDWRREALEKAVGDVQTFIGQG